MKKLAIVAVTILLAACSGGPNDAEVQAAVREQFEGMNETAQQMGMDQRVELHSARSLGCKQATERQGYVCDVEIDVSMPMVGRKSGVTPIRFIESEKGWRAVDEPRAR